MSIFDNIRRGKDPYADADAVIAHLEATNKVFLPFNIPATELGAPTSIELVAPVNGAVTGIRATVQTTTGTGGVITVEINTVAIDGLSLTIPDTSTKGTRFSDTVSADEETAAVSVGDRIEIQPAAEFAATGVIAGVLEITVTA